MQISTAWAMSIACVNRLQFNEAVAAGHYSCAPGTEERSQRLFDFNDLIGLCVFGRMIRLGLSKRIAGDIACKAVMYVRQDGEDLERVVVAMKDDGTVWTGPCFFKGQDKGRMWIDPESPNAAASIQVNIPLIREFIIERCKSLVVQHGDEAPNVRAMLPEGWEKSL